MLEQSGKARGDQETVKIIMNLLDKVEENVDNSVTHEREREEER